MLGIISECICEDIKKRLMTSRFFFLLKIRLLLSQFVIKYPAV